MSYATFTLEQLRAAVEPHTKLSIVKEGTGAYLAMERGARVIGLYPRADLPNVLWVHANVNSFLAEGNWFVGGERLWLAPERNFFYENPRDFEGQHVPADIDPGNYRADHNHGYRSTFSLVDLMSSAVHDDVVATRRFAPLKDPYGTSLAFAGVTIDDSVSAPVSAAPFCAWTLAMVYTCGADNPGTAFFPVKKGGTFISYFDPIPAKRADIHDHYARFRIDGEAIYKFALAPEDIVFDNVCKVVYVSPYPDSDLWFCVIKRSDGLPRKQSECVDPSKANPDGLRGATQSYNHGPSTGPIETAQFGEIELQLVKAKKTDGHLVSAASHELLAYAGSKKEILGLAGAALGLDEPPRPY